MGSSPLENWNHHVWHRFQFVDIHWCQYQGICEDIKYTFILILTGYIYGFQGCTEIWFCRYRLTTISNIQRIKIIYRLCMHRFISKKISESIVYNHWLDCICMDDEKNKIIHFWKWRSLFYPLVVGNFEIKHFRFMFKKWLMIEVGINLSSFIK